MRACDTCPIFFDDVRVPQRNRIGEEGMGFMMQMVQFQEERLWAAAAGLMAHGARDRSRRSTTCAERHAFGQPLIDNQVVHFRLAELADRGRAAALAGLSRRSRNTSAAPT